MGKMQDGELKTIQFTVLLILLTGTLAQMKNE